jgi:multisubunit Na+/H+ antiporter MnhB subunit
MKLGVINLGAIFVGLILALVAAYLFIYGGSESDRFFAGGIVLIVAIVLFIIPAINRKEKK